ncbi:unnamed protein product [Camellia sinensis]
MRHRRILTEKSMEAEIVAKPQAVNPCCVVLKEKYSKLEASRNALRQGFTRMVLSLWAMTMLSLYIRVQVNILGRHLYIDTARDLGSSHLLDEADLIDRNDQQQFLAAASEVLKGKQLKDLFNTTVLHETTVPILDMFMSMGSPHHWVDYLMPEDPNFYKLVAFSNSDSTDPSDSTKFDRLMVETRAVLSRGAELTGEQKTAPDTEVRNGPLGGTHEPNSTLDMELDGSVTVHPNNHCKAGNVIHETREIDEPEAQIEDQNDGFKDNGLEDKRPGSDANQTETKNSSNVALALYRKISSLGDSVSSQDSGDTLLCNGDATDADQSMVHEEDDTENDLIFSVLKHSEQLLERLKSLKGATCKGMNGYQSFFWKLVYLVDAYDKERFAEAKKELDALHKKQQY